MMSRASALASALQPSVSLSLKFAQDFPRAGFDWKICSL